MPNIPWDTKLEVVLMRCVVKKNAHMSKGKQATIAWNKVLDAFFSDKLLHNIRESHYVKGSFRKLREKYKSVMLRVVATYFDVKSQTWKNEGKGSDKLLVQHVSRVFDDICSRHGLIKNLGELSETQFRTFTRGSYNGDGSLKRKFDVANEELTSAAEREAEVQLLSWISDHQLKMVNLLVECNLRLKHQDVLEEIGLRTLVSIFCDGAKFSPDLFRTEMKELGISPIMSNKIYKGLQSWRKESSRFRLQGSRTTTSAL
jgi:hypothetical protein